MSYTILIDVCWAAMGVVWLLGALYNLIKAPTTVRRSPGWFLPMLLGLALVAANHFWGPAGFWAGISARSNPLADIGSVVLIAGTIFTLWARLTLGTMWSSSAEAKEGHALKTSGPYAVTRHPIYTGLLVMLAGTVLIKALGVWVFYFGLGVVLAEIKIRLEENLLVETLGEAYERYRKQVPQLIPGLNLFNRGRNAG